LLTVRLSFFTAYPLVKVTATPGRCSRLWSWNCCMGAAVPACSLPIRYPSTMVVLSFFVMAMRSQVFCGFFRTLVGPCRFFSAHVYCVSLVVWGGFRYFFSYFFPVVKTPSSVLLFFKLWCISRWLRFLGFFIFEFVASIPPLMAKPPPPIDNDTLITPSVPSRPSLDLVL